MVLLGKLVGAFFRPLICIFGTFELSVEAGLLKELLAYGRLGTTQRRFGECICRTGPAMVEIKVGDSLDDYVSVSWVLRLFPVGFLLSLNAIVRGHCSWGKCSQVESYGAGKEQQQRLYKQLSCFFEQRHQATTPQRHRKNTTKLLSVFKHQ